MTLIRRDRRDHIELWTLDRPDRLNALPDLGDGEAFAAACEAVNADQGVRCVEMAFLRCSGARAAAARPTATALSPASTRSIIRTWPRAAAWLANSGDERNSMTRV